MRAALTNSARAQGAVLAGALLLLGGCAGISATETELRPERSPRIRSVAVVGFENLTTTAQAGESVASVITAELQRRGGLHVVGVPGTAGSSERWTAAKLGKSLDRDAVLVGTVTAYEYRPGARAGSPVKTPTVSVDVRLVASATSEVLWVAGFEANESQVLSYDGAPLEELTQDIAERVADALDELREGT